MHVPTGNIVEIDEEQREFMRNFAESIPERTRNFDIEKKMVELTETETQELQHLSKPKRKGYMRNQPCVCGSGEKFKKCCWRKFS